MWLDSKLHTQKLPKNLSNWTSSANKISLLPREYNATLKHLQSEETHSDGVIAPCVQRTLSMRPDLNKQPSAARHIWAQTDWHKSRGGRRRGRDGSSRRAPAPPTNAFQRQETNTQGKGHAYTDRHKHTPRLLTNSPQNSIRAINRLLNGARRDPASLSLRLERNFCYKQGPSQWRSHWAISSVSGWNGETRNNNNNFYDSHRGDFTDKHVRMWRKSSLKSEQSL